MSFGSVKLNDGNEMPTIAFGTGSALAGRVATDNVELAIENGFSHIDTAQIYGNEDSVGVAISEEGLKRDELFITTKYWEGDIAETMQSSLKKLGLKFVDLYLIHHPRLVEGRLEASWQAFEKIKMDGYAKSIGVSNFSLEDTKALLKLAKIKPSVNQIRLHPYNWAEMKDLVEFSKKHGIVIEAYSSLTPITRTPGGPVDQVLTTIGVRIGATPAQVIFAWLKSKGVVIVTTTTKQERLKEYLDVAGLPDLTDAEIESIEEAGAKGPPSALTLRLRTIANRAVTLTIYAALFFILCLIMA